MGPVLLNSDQSFKRVGKAKWSVPFWPSWDHTARCQNGVLKADLWRKNVSLHPVPQVSDSQATVPSPWCACPCCPAALFRAKQLLLLEMASTKLIQWIIMRAILVLPFYCWDGDRFIEADSGWYLGTDNYLHLLYPRLLRLNIYCPEFCPFQPILNTSMPQATNWYNSFRVTINLRLPPEMMQKINGTWNQVNGIEYSN